MPGKYLPRLSHACDDDPTTATLFCVFLSISSRILTTVLAWSNLQSPITNRLLRSISGGRKTTAIGCGVSKDVAHCNTLARRSIYNFTKYLLIFENSEFSQQLIYKNKITYNIIKILKSELKISPNLERVTTLPIIYLQKIRHVVSPPCMHQVHRCMQAIFYRYFDPAWPVCRPSH